jgi:hypothetical protein
MYIKVNKKKYKFEFDALVCAEIIGLIFKLNYDLTGKNYLMLDDLSLILFQIDITSLIHHDSVVTGESYWFNDRGVLSTNYLNIRVKSNNVYLNNVLYSNNVLMPIEFKKGINIFNKQSICLLNTATIGDSNLSEHTIELTVNAFNKYLRGELQDSVYTTLFNTDGVTQNKGKRNYSPISLDYIINTLKLNREGIIECLSLHNVQFNTY